MKLGTCSYERSVWKLWRALLNRTSTSSVRGLISGSLLDHEACGKISRILSLDQGNEVQKLRM